MQKRRATIVGFTAILLWSFLAVFTVGSAPMPPLQLNAICFAISGFIGLIWVSRGIGFSALRTVSWKIYAFGTLGLFGYHFLYFSALRLAPPAEAGLIAYLWPLLIVLFSGLLPEEQLKRQHIVGAVLGFTGAAILIGNGASMSVTALPGYALALACAITWSGYSVISRKLGGAPTETVAIFCVLTALFSLIAHFAFETTYWPSEPVTWLSIVALGLGPVGIAFYTWDIGMKKGDIQLLGVTSYAAPVISTCVLVLAGVTQASWPLAVSAALITLGAVIAARTNSRNTDSELTGGDI
ncbi:DMT family transporter [Falsihalocynthiibacter sp. SS001]|uniref:aromatic amino acid exporter YddG n=1 Tax=Falsihalocynthiibacter sp. SS001 TaxID=3349698 RepID=UPI0036D2AAF9